jgi:hypothetical protein
LGDHLAAARRAATGADGNGECASTFATGACPADIEAHAE